jgi:hypothetical protein
MDRGNSAYDILYMLGNKMNQVNQTSAINNPIAKGTAKLKADAIKLTAEISASITEGTKKTIGATLTKKKTLDLMQAQKIKSAHLEIAAKSYADLQKQIKQAIVLGFTADTQALLLKETKTLSEGEKTNKRVAQQQIGSEFAYYRRELKKREERESAKAEGGTAEKSTPVEMYFKDLQSALDRLAKMEELPFDLVQHTSALKKLLADK